MNQVALQQWLALWQREVPAQASYPCSVEGLCYIIIDLHRRCKVQALKCQKAAQVFCLASIHGSICVASPGQEQANEVLGRSARQFNEILHEHARAVHRIYTTANKQAHNASRACTRDGVTSKF